MSKKQSSFRVGRVGGYLRGRVWYLCYHENGQRHRPRIGPSRDTARLPILTLRFARLGDDQRKALLVSSRVKTMTPIFDDGVGESFWAPRL